MWDEHGALLPHVWVAGVDDMGRPRGFRQELSSTLALFRSPISQKSRENQANSTFATPPESLGFAKTRATIAETLENRAILGPENGPKSNSGGLFCRPLRGIERFGGWRASLWRNPKNHRVFSSFAGCCITALTPSASIYLSMEFLIGRMMANQQFPDSHFVRKNKGFLKLVFANSCTVYLLPDWPPTREI